MASVKTVISGYVPHDWQRNVKSNDKVFSKWNHEDVKAISNDRYIRDVLGSTNRTQKYNATRRVKLPALNNNVERNIQSKITHPYDRKRTGESCSLMCCHHSWIKRDEIPLSVILERKLKEVALLQVSYNNRNSSPNINAFLKDIMIAWYYADAIAYFTTSMLKIAILEYCTCLSLLQQTLITVTYCQHYLSCY